jgi:hypothetical protein
VGGKWSLELLLNNTPFFEKVVNPPDNRQSPLARNRMLIRNGSSFNAVVRALKQDLLENAAPEVQDTNLIYEVDKVTSTCTRSSVVHDIVA